MKTVKVKNGAFARSVLLFLFAGMAGVSFADSTWKAGVWSGSWSVADNWDGGVPSSSSSAAISNADGDYCVRVENLASVSSLSLLNGTDYTSLLAVSNSLTATSGAKWSIGAGGLLQIGTGGAVSLPGVGCSTTNGGKIVVDGGSLTWTKGIPFAIGCPDDKTAGQLEIREGSVVFDNSYGDWGTGARIHQYGSVDVSGGELVLKGALNNQADPARVALQQRSIKDRGGRITVRNSGRLDMSSGVQGVSSDCILSNDAVMAFGSNPVTFSARCAFGYAPWRSNVCRLEFKDNARIEGCCGSFRIGGYAWYNSELKTETHVTFDSDAVHGNGLATETIGWNCGRAFGSLVVGVGYGTNEMNLCRGFLPVGISGVRIGVADSPLKGGENTSVLGTLNVCGGTLFVSGYAGVSPGWDSNLPIGLIVGQGNNVNTNTSRKGLGVLSVSSGTITNAVGHFIVGLGVAEGSYVQSGGSVLANPTSEWAPNMTDFRRTNAVAAVGLRGGVGSFSISGGSFKLGAKLFVGGAPVAEFAVNNASFTNKWDETYPSEGTPSVGSAKFDGGTFVAARDFIVGAAGSGRVAFGPSASVTIGGDFVLSNQTSSVVTFKAGVDGFRTVDVEGRFVVADGARIEVDLTDYAPAKKVCLVAFSSREGTFGDENVTVKPSNVRLTWRSNGLYAGRPNGLVLHFK